MHKIIYILVALSFYLEVLSVSAATTRVVGGFEVPANSIKYHASLQNLTGHHVCGGAIISYNHVVTAAHCIQGADPKFIKIVVGTTDLDDGGKTYDVENFTLHYNYVSVSRINDIALIKSKTRFKKELVEVLDLYKDELKEGDMLLLTGFGASEPNGESKRQIQALNLPVFSQETCRYAMRYNREVFDTMFCTFTRIGEGTCHGDSGGPLVKDHKLAGIVSWGLPCAVGFPDVHTRIDPYVEWIHKILKKNEYKKKKRKPNKTTRVKVSLLVNKK